MSVVLESRMLRDFLHRLIDNLMNDLEASPKVSAVAAVLSVPSTATTKPRITLEPPVKKAPTAKPAPAPRQQCPDVTISCRSSCSALEIAVNLSAVVAQRLGLKPHGKAALDLHRNKLRVRCAPGKGRAVYSGGPTGRVFFSVWADTYGVTEKHAPESCTFHYDLEDALLIEAPAWLKATKPAAPRVEVKGGGKAEKKTAVVASDDNSATHCSECHAARKVGEMYECPLCVTLSCKPEIAPCWQTHVQKFHHSTATRRAPTGHAADLGK